MKTMKVKEVYLVYVDTNKLKSDGLLLELYDDARYKLFGVTTDPRLLQEFLLIHREDLFVIHHEKFDHSVERGKIQSIFNEYMMEHTVMGCGVWIDKKLTYQELALVLTHTESVSIGYELEAWDDFLYDFYTDIELYLTLFSADVFTDELMDTLRILSYKKILKYMSKEYINRYESSTIVDSLKINEWGQLRASYGELLIGGEKDEDSYI